MTTQFEQVINKIKTNSGNGWYVLDALLAYSHPTLRENISCSEILELLENNLNNKHENKIVIDDELKLCKLHFTDNCKVEVNQLSNSKYKLNFRFSVDKASVLPYCFTKYLFKRNNAQELCVGLMDCSFLLENERIQKLLNALNVENFIKTDIDFSFVLTSSESEQNHKHGRAHGHVTMQIVPNEFLNTSSSIQDRWDLTFDSVAFWKQNNSEKQKLLKEIVLECLVNHQKIMNKPFNQEEQGVFNNGLENHSLINEKAFLYANDGKCPRFDLCFQIQDLRLFKNAKINLDLNEFTDIDLRIKWRGQKFNQYQLKCDIPTDKVMSVKVYLSNKVPNHQVLELRLTNDESNLQLFNEETIQMVNDLSDTQKQEERQAYLATIKSLGGLFLVTLAHESEQEVDVNDQYVDNSITDLSGYTFYSKGVDFTQYCIYGEDLVQFTKECKQEGLYTIMSISEVPEILLDFVLNNYKLFAY